MKKSIIYMEIPPFPIFRRKGSGQAVRYFRRSHRASRKPPAVRAAQSRKSGIWDRISACLYREERSVKIGLVLSPSSHWGSMDPKSAMPPSRKPAARVAAIRTRPRIPTSDIRYPETKPYVRQKRAKPLFLGPAEVGAGSVCSSSSR